MQGRVAAHCGQVDAQVDQRSRHIGTQPGEQRPRAQEPHRAGQLVMDRVASQGSRHAVVLVDGAEEAEEVPVAALTIEEILPP